MLNQHITVSIIIPNYNHAAYLQQRLDTIFNQTFQDFEVIILDDSSTDGSQELLKSYAEHPKVSQVILNTTNSGSVYEQWVKGIQLAKGNYIWLAESDDYSDLRFLENTVKILDARDKLGMVFTDTLKIDSNGNHLGLVSESKIWLRNLHQEDGLINASNVTQYLLHKMVVVNASSVLFRKSSLFTVDFDVLKTFKNTGDVFVYLHIALNNEAFFLSKQLNFMRLHSLNTTKKGKKSGAIYIDKLKLLDFYLPHLKTLVNTQELVLNYFHSIFFFSLDHKLYNSINSVLKHLLALKYLNRTAYLKAKRLGLYYRCFTYHGRPNFIRKLLKSALQRALSIS